MNLADWTCLPLSSRSLKWAVEVDPVEGDPVKGEPTKVDPVEVQQTWK